MVPFKLVFIFFKKDKNVWVKNQNEKKKKQKNEEKNL